MLALLQITANPRLSAGFLLSTTLLYIAILSSPALSQQLPAFPGAVGFGTDTPGGRGGRVLKVTRLQDDLRRGSLRWAVTQQGPRIIVFDIGGLIELKSDLRITEPFVTIAGQTAPGSGITLSLHRLTVVTHDVVIRGIRARPGDGEKGAPGERRDGISIGNFAQPSSVHNVVIDHCSIMWGTDKNLGTWYAPHDVTISWNIIAYGLNDSIHPEGLSSHGLLIGDGSERITIHHNLFAHNADRNPTIKPASQIEFVNNIVYNWGEQALNNYGDKTASVSVIGNWFVSGADSVQRPPVYIRRHGRMYLRDNIDTHYRTHFTQDQYRIAHSYNEPIKATSRLRHERPLFAGSGIVADSPSTLESRLAEFVGAVTHRDSVDRTVILDLINRTGRIIDSPEALGGYPQYYQGSAARDSDHDGMPDQYEMRFGFDKFTDDSARDHDSDGYTNIEEYINNLIDSAKKRM